MFFTYIVEIRYFVEQQTILLFIYSKVNLLLDSDTGDDHIFLSPSHGHHHKSTVIIIAHKNIQTQQSFSLNHILQ